MMILFYIHTQTTPTEHSNKYEYFCQKYNLLISFSNRMKNEGIDWFDCTPFFILPSYSTIFSSSILYGGQISVYIMYG
jgi:hypothetical protein